MITKGYLPLLILLTACTSPPKETPPALQPKSEAASGPCRAEGGAAMIGKMGTAENVERARVSTGSELARRIEPGQAVTMDFREERVNVEVDASGVIIKIICG